MVGGYLAEHRALTAAFALVACFPVVSFLMALLVVREAPARPNLEGFGETWSALRAALGRRDLWVVAGFIVLLGVQPVVRARVLLLPDRRPRLLPDVHRRALLAGVRREHRRGLGLRALSRRYSLKRLIVWSIGAGVLGTLAYLVYRGPVSAIVITVVFGAIGMTTQLAFLDLAAKACPRRVEATFFALLMSVYNLGMRSGEWTGANLYDWVGYTPLVLISTAFTAAAWLLVPLVPIDAIQAAAQASSRSSRSTASLADS